MPAIFDADGTYLHDAEPIPAELIEQTPAERLTAALDALTDGTTPTLADLLSALRDALA
jgi:hypothetical protein